MPAPAQPRLAIENLSCGAGERALFRGLDFVLAGGEAARVRGANGVGKTTFLRTVAGLQRPLAGSVRWHGRPVRDEEEPPSLASALCFVAHDNALNTALTPVENLEHLMRLAGRRVSRDHIRDTLERLGLARIADRVCHRLSAGQKRRVSLARLRMTEAPLWLLDEPAAALDTRARDALAAYLADHVADGGLVLYTTHETLDLPGVSVRPIDLPSC